MTRATTLSLIRRYYDAFNAGEPEGMLACLSDKIALVMTTTEGSQAVSDSRDIRRVALMDKIPYFTTAAASVAAVAAMKARGEGYGVRTLQG